MQATFAQSLSAPVRAPRLARVQRRVVAEAATENGASAATATLEKKDRKLSPLERGGTLKGAAAAGKDASEKFKAAAEGAASAGGPVLQMVDGRFSDYRWKNGRWDLELFKGKDGETNWDAVIDAEMARRKLLEDSPIPCTNEDPVLFDTAEIPWWAWVRRFHLPEAEKLNGRAAMMGYVLALFVDQLTGVGLLDQQNSFIGKVLLHVCVFAILLVRTTSDLDKYKNLLDEATFYDKQWNATWEGQERPSDN